MTDGGLTFAELLNLPENSVIENGTVDEWVLIEDGWVCSAEGALGSSEPDSLYSTWAPLSLKSLDDDRS
jgi:hypothetical protein